MKNILFTLLCLSLLSLGPSWAQTKGPTSSANWFGGNVVCPEPAILPTGPAPGTFPPKPVKTIIPCGKKEITNVRVNIKWVLRTNGTGNFTEDGDGNVAPGGNINGFNRAEMLIDRLNRHWRDNTQMNFPVGNTTVVKDTRVRFVLSSICFIRNDDYYQNGAKNGLDDWSILAEYGTNVWEEINIFITEKPDNVGASGIANQPGQLNLNIPLAMKVYDEWSRDYRSKYIFNQPHAAQPYYNGGNTGTLHGGTHSTNVISHEFGHLFGLTHTWLPDAFPDTPTLPLPNCWLCGRNNVMDYGGEVPYAITPYQIDHIRWFFTGDGGLYTHSCSDCLPANAFFKAPESLCYDIPGEFTIDARGSYNEAQYQLRITRVQQVGGWQPYPTASNNEWISPWYYGKAGEIDIMQTYPYSGNMSSGDVYRILLAVQNYDDNGTLCTGWHEYVRWVTVYPCARPKSNNRLIGSYSVPLQLFPNPTSNQFTLQYDLSGFSQAEVRLYNLTGQQVYIENVDVRKDKSQVYVGHLPSGAYLLRLMADGQPVAHEKLIISK